MSRALIIITLILCLFSPVKGVDELDIGSSTFVVRHTPTEISLTIRDLELTSDSRLATISLKDPDRLVIDISPPLRPPNGQYRLIDGGCKRLRLNTYSVKTRVVLDCQSLPDGSFSVENLPGSATIRFSSSEPPKTITPTSQATTTTMGASTTNGVQILKAITFLSDDESNSSLVLKFTRPGNYSLLRGIDHRTILKVKQAELAGSHLELEHFAPNSIVGIIAVIPQRDVDGSLLFNVLLEEGFSLRGEWRGEELHLMAVK